MFLRIKKSSAGLTRALLGNVGHVLIYSAALRISPKPVGYWAGGDKPSAEHSTHRHRTTRKPCIRAWPETRLILTSFSSTAVLHSPGHGTAGSPGPYAVCPGSQSLASFCRPETEEHLSPATHAQAHRLRTGAQTGAWLCRRGEHAADTEPTLYKGTRKVRLQLSMQNTV